MRAMLLTTLFFVACSTEKLVATEECGKPCTPKGMIIIGECRPGIWACLNDGEMECINVVGPSTEVCDGKDNDCDGQVDNHEAVLALCENSCGRGVQECRRGALTECSAPKPSTEVCDGKDNDCDGQVDEGIDVHYCYTGPGLSVAFGICHPGIARCNAGVETCFGEQTPRGELCDGLDNDCDGSVDEGATPTELLDTVVIFDNSGSMEHAAESLKTATKAWTQKYASNTQRRYALVAAPDVDPLLYVPTLVQDFTDADTFADAMETQNGRTGSATEPTIDAIESVIDEHNEMRLSWRPGSKRTVIIFTDEAPQSYVGSCWGECPGAVGRLSSTLAQGGYVVHVFTTSGEADIWNPWSSISSASGGNSYDIIGSVTDIEAELDQILDQSACLP